MSDIHKPVVNEDNFGINEIFKPHVKAFFDKAYARVVLRHKPTGLYVSVFGLTCHKSGAKSFDISVKLSEIKEVMTFITKGSNSPFKWMKGINPEEFEIDHAHFFVNSR